MKCISSNINGRTELNITRRIWEYWSLVVIYLCNLYNYGDIFILGVQVDGRKQRR